jgi:hypothetical protein
MPRRTDVLTPNKDDKPDDHRPYLTIPYWTAGTLSSGDPGDDGEIRPVPTGVISYLCPGIHASTYVPGSDLTVTVDVRNSGGGNTTAPATVTVWWEVPAPSFGPLSANNLIGVALVAVPPRGQQATTTAMTKVIPPGAGPHICLLARVNHPLDVASNVPDPVGLRHWAQRNLFYVNTSSEMPLDLTFWANNPLQQEAEFTLHVQPVARENLYQLARTVRAEPIVTKARFELRDGRETFKWSTDREPIDAHSVELPAGARRPVHLRIDLATTPAEGQFAGFEILQYLTKDKRVLGSLGVVVMAPRQHCG